MSNPNTLASIFNGSAPGWAITGPERYNAGLWLEESGTNLLWYTVAGSNTTGWTTSASATLARVTSLPAPLPSPLASLVTTGYRATANSDIAATATIFDHQISGSNGATYCISGYLYVPSTYTPSSLTVSALSFGSATGSLSTVVSLTGKYDTWIPVVVGPFTMAADVSGAIRVQHTTGTWPSGVAIYGTGWQLTNTAYATSFIAGSLGAGYAWSGTAFASSSTRAASSAAISPSGILTPSSGALAFRITPTIETGVEEIWFECGAKGSGTDHFRRNRDSSTHPFIEWSSNNASYQRLTASETVSAGQQIDVYTGHTGTVTSLAVEAGTLQTGTRDAISDSWGAGDLTLKATAGGVVYNQFATFNRTLTTSEIKTLDRRTSWSRTMFGNPFAYFQLRPY